MTKKPFIKNRKMRYGGMTLLLTVLIVTAIVLFNAVFDTLAKRYSWVTDLKQETNYEVTDTCYALLGNFLADGRNLTDPVTVIFCDLEENLVKNTASRYVYQTALSFAERFPDRVRLAFTDIYLNPDSVRAYTTSTHTDPLTGAPVTTETALNSTSVIITCGEYSRVYSQNEFFIYHTNASTPWAYNGERRFAAGILRAINPDRDAHLACVTSNHGEAFSDFELLYLLDDAGYNITYIDLSVEEIPESCDLIVTYNPNKDLTVADSVSDISEVDKLDAFLAKPDHMLFLLLGDATPSLPNFESFLSGWGVNTCYYTEGEASYRYMVQDSVNSLTSDGYTIYGYQSSCGTVRDLLSGLDRAVVFKNATALRPADGYLTQGDGSYIKADRTLYSLYEGGKGVVSWANGYAVDSSGVMLMTLTKQETAGGSSWVAVAASTEFGNEEFLQSAVYGNGDSVLRLTDRIGGMQTPEGLTIKPFQLGSMSTVTMGQMVRWTVSLALIPALVVLALAVVILVRRKHS